MQAARRISSHAGASRPGALRRALSVRLLLPLGGFTTAAAVMTPALVNYEQTGLKVCLASGTSKAHINYGLLLLLHHWHQSHGKLLPNAAVMHGHFSGLESLSGYNRDQHSHMML
ncbi:unnamed protein product [Lota lota]